MIKLVVYKRETPYPSFAAHREPISRGEEIFVGETRREALAKAAAFATGAPWDELQADDPHACEQFRTMYVALGDVPEEGDCMVVLM